MIVSRIWNLNTRGNGGDEDDMDKEASFANLVRDRDDDDKFAILWNFSSDDDLIMRNICHESFHIAMSVCQFATCLLDLRLERMNTQRI